jgi:hypothetical protein
MFSSHPKFTRRLIQLDSPIGNYTHAVECPRCRKYMCINSGMVAGRESIICNNTLNGRPCGGHYYWKLEDNALEFIGTKQN